MVFCVPDSRPASLDCQYKPYFCSSFQSCLDQSSLVWLLPLIFLRCTVFGTATLLAAFWTRYLLLTSVVLSDRHNSPLLASPTKVPATYVLEHLSMKRSELLLESIQPARFVDTVHIHLMFCHDGWRATDRIKRIFMASQLLPQKHQDAKSAGICGSVPHSPRYRFLNAGPPR